MPTAAEYLRHKAIGTWLEPLAGLARHGINAVKRGRHPELAEVFRESDVIARVLRRHERGGMNCVDVGAHLGSMTALFRRLSPSGRHSAVEPTPY